MKKSRIYAWKALLPRLSRGDMYALIALGAVVLTLNEPTMLNWLLTGALCIGAAVFLCMVYAQYGRDYYSVSETAVLLHRDGKQINIPIDTVAFASYDGSALGVELHLENEEVISFHEFLELKPLITALDDKDIRVEYKRMGKR